MKDIQTRCNKCGSPNHVDPRVVYCASCEMAEAAGLRTEHLHRECLACGYHWMTPPLDAATARDKTTMDALLWQAFKEWLVADYERVCGIVGEYPEIRPPVIVDEPGEQA